MRILTYVVILMALLTIVSYNGSPIHAWLENYRMAAQQHAIVQTNQRLTVMNSGLIVLLTAQPSFARVRVALIHNGISPGGDTVLLWDIVDEAVQAGHIAGEKVTNQPLSQWSDYLGTLLNKQCAYVPANTLTNDPAKERLQTIKIAAFLVCPIMNKKDQLLGGLFASWDDLDNVPHDLEPAKKALQAAAEVLGATVKPNG